MNLRFSYILLPGLALAGAVNLALAQEQSVPRSTWPLWLLEKTKEYESQPPQQVPLEIWQLTHNAETSYFVVAPCCDRFNNLYSFAGQVLCSPSGGFTGRGDGRCPQPADMDTKVLFVWAHPKSSKKKRLAPSLGKS